MTEAAEAITALQGQLADTKTKLFATAEAAATHLKQLAEARKALTPNDRTKCAYIGAFKFDQQTGWDEDGLEIYQTITVPWPTTTEIMAAIRTCAGLKGWRGRL